MKEKMPLLSDYNFVTINQTVVMVIVFRLFYKHGCIGME